MAFSANNEYMQSEGNSRKRVRISRDNEPRNTMASASSSTLDGTHAHTTAGPCHFEQSFRTLQPDLEAMRGLITCQICHRFMYEPYVLQCGHTYCYSCVSSWFRGKTRKNCPECRMQIVQTPTPSYIIKEMVLIFTSRTQLLPDGETSEEHMNFANEEADIVAKDRADEDPRTGGLFKGAFRARQMLVPLRDVSDNVYRCPNCLHEIEDGWCNQCGEPVGDDHEGFSDIDSDDESEELDADLEDNADNMGFDMVDDQAAIELIGNGRIRIRHGRQRGTHSPIEVSSHTSDDESDSEADEDETEFNNLVVPDDANIYDDSASDDGLPHSEDFEPGSEPAQPVATRSNRRARQTVVLSSDDEDDARPTASRSRANRQVINVDDDEDDVQPATDTNVRGGRRGSGQHGAVGVSESSDGDSDGESESQSESDSGEDDESDNSDGSQTDRAEDAHQPNQIPRFDFHRRGHSNREQHTIGSEQNSEENDEGNDMHWNDHEAGTGYDDEDEEGSDIESDSGSTHENENNEQYPQPPFNSNTHRLHTGGQRRSRHVIIEATSQLAHPFQLSRTLAQIQDRQRTSSTPAYTRVPPISNNPRRAVSTYRPEERRSAVDPTAASSSSHDTRNTNYELYLTCMQRCDPERYDRLLRGSIVTIRDGRPTILDSEAADYLESRFGNLGSNVEREARRLNKRVEVQLRNRGEQISGDEEPADNSTRPRNNHDESQNSTNQGGQRQSRRARRRANRSPSRQARGEQDWMDPSAREQSVNTYNTRPGDWVRASMGTLVRASRRNNNDGAHDYQAPDHAQDHRNTDDTAQQRRPQRNRSQRRRAAQAAQRARSSSQHGERQQHAWDGVHAAQDGWQDYGQSQRHQRRRATFDFAGARA